MGTYREESKKEWTTVPIDGTPTHEQIKIGCLQRIADATEKMAIRYTAMQDENDRLREVKKHLVTRLHLCYRQNAALRGVITRMKGKTERGKREGKP